MPSNTPPKSAGGKRFGRRAEGEPYASVGRRACRSVWRPPLRTTRVGGGILRARIPDGDVRAVVGAPGLTHLATERRSQMGRVFGLDVHNRYVHGYEW